MPLPDSSWDTSLLRLASPSSASAANPAANHFQPRLSPERPGIPDSLLAVPGYQVLWELGRGGMGLVYAARQTGLNRLVALKMIFSEPRCEEPVLARFRAEAQIIARLNHPNIIQIYEVGQVDGRPYFALEFVSGGSLADRLRGQPQPADGAAWLVETLARAIHAAHQEGIIHRDLKPDNVLLQRDESEESRAESPKEGQATTGSSQLATVLDSPLSALRPKITDFGVAKQLDAPSLLTQTGDVLGTPSYMAPEQAAGHIDAIGPATDVYALGAILYEALTGRPPFLAATGWDTVVQVMSTDPIPPRRLQPQVPRDLETICLKCLAKAPRRRYASAADLADDLNRFRAGKPIQARPARFWERGVKWARRRPAAAALLAALALIAATASQYLYQRAASAEHRLAQREQIDLRFSAGRQFANDQDWSNAKVQFASALASIGGDLSLENLRAPIEHSLAEADRMLTDQQARQLAQQKMHRFERLHDETLFHGMVLTGVDLPRNVQAARRAGKEALALFGLDPDRDAALVVDPFLKDRQEEVACNCYEMMLILASVESQSPSGQTEDPEQAARALGILDRAARLGPATKAFHYRRARYLERVGDHTAARQARMLGDALEATRAIDAFLLGEERWQEGNLPEAIREFEKAAQLDPQHFWANYHLSVCYLSTQRPDLARSSLAVCITRKPAFPWSYMLRGITNTQLRDFTAAERDYEQGLKLEGSGDVRYGILMNRGMLRAQEKRFYEAEADLRTAIPMKPDWHQAYWYLARVCQQQRKLAEAGQYFDSAVSLAERSTAALRPEDLSRLYQQRARLHVLGHHLDAAMQDLERAVHVQSKGSKSLVLAEVYVDRGGILRSRRKNEEALGAYDAALRIRPEFRKAHKGRGKTLLELHRHEEAVWAFDRYLALGDPDADVCQARGRAHAALGNYAIAIEDYTQALRLRPDDPLTRGCRGWTYLASHAPTLAMRDFEEVLHHRPANADALMGRGQARVQLGQVSEGVADAEASLRLGPEIPRLTWNAARVFAQASARVGTGRGQGLGSTPQVRRQYQDRAVRLIRQALEILPRNQRAPFWQEHVQRDAALEPVRGHLSFVRLEAEYASPGKKLCSAQ